MNNWMDGRCTRYDVTRSHRVILADDRTDALAAKRTFQAIRLETVDDLQTGDETRVLQEVEHGAIERQRRQVALPQLTDGDLVDEAGAGVLFWIPVVEAVDILDQRDRRAAEALCQEVCAGIRAMRRDTTQGGRVFPQGERRIPVEDDARRRLDKEGQQVTEDFRRDGDDAIRGQQRAQHVRIPQGISDGQLGENAGRQAEIDAYREDVPAADAATGADDEFSVGECRPDRLNQRVGARLTAVEDGAASHLDDMAVREHAHHWCLGRGHHLLVEQALAHQQRPNVVATICHWFPGVLHYTLPLVPMFTR